MSAIALNMMIVDTGNSSGSAAKPNVPPAARWGGKRPMQ
jgi:hypothetical protein